METDTLVLLAGGLATRLRPLTEKIPKSMVEVAGRPFIYHQLNLIKGKGIRKAVICAGSMGDQIEKYTGAGERFGINIAYSYDGDSLLGTGGAIKKALRLLPENFFVMYGDSYLDTDFKIINQYFLKEKKSGLMTVYRNDDKWDKSNIVFSENEIVLYDKKKRTKEMHYIDYGLGILSQEAFDDFKDEEVFDLESEYQNLLEKKELAGFEVKERFYEIGSVSGLEETEKYLKGKIDNQ